MSEPAFYESLFSEELYVLPPTVCIVLDKPWTSLSEEEKNLLQKILGSVKLSMASVRVISTARIEASMVSTFNAEKIITFGPVWDQNVLTYEAIKIDNIDVIVAHPLAQLDDVRKKSLWLALKKAFVI